MVLKHSIWLLVMGTGCEENVLTSKTLLSSCLSNLCAITQEGLKPLLLGELVCPPLKVTVFTQLERLSPLSLL